MKRTYATLAERGSARACRLFLKRGDQRFLVRSRELAQSLERGLREIALSHLILRLRSHGFFDELVGSFAPPSARLSNRPTLPRRNRQRPGHRRPTRMVRRRLGED